LLPARGLIVLTGLNRHPLDAGLKEVGGKQAPLRDVFGCHALVVPCSPSTCRASKAAREIYRCHARRSRKAGVEFINVDQPGVRLRKPG
jgi:hypothetical protein